MRILIAEVYQPQAKAQNKKWSVNIPEDISLVGDKNAIQQMLSVLLDNAIRYSDAEGEIRFGISIAIAKAVVQAHGGTITASCPSEKTMTIKASIKS